MDDLFDPPLHTPTLSHNNTMATYELTRTDMFLDEIVFPTSPSSPKTKRRHTTFDTLLDEALFGFLFFFKTTSYQKIHLAIQK